MNTLIFSQKSPLHLAKPSSSKQISPAQNPKTPQKTLKNPPTNWKLQANAKGFANSRPPAIQENSTATTKKTSSRNSNNTNNEGDEDIPEVVFYRIIIRVLVSVGVPMAVGFGSMYVLGMMMEQNIWNAPRWVLFLTLFLTFGASILGLPYGALSASMDPNKEGSFLGFEQVQNNWVEMWKEEDEGRNSWD